MTAPDPTLAGLSDDLRRQLESLLIAFDRDWDEDRLAAEAAKLPSDHPLRGPALAEMVRIDLERRWCRPNRTAVPPLEDYLRTYPELGTPQTVAVELIAAEHEARRLAGAAPPAAEFAERFPGRTEELRRRLESDRTAGHSTLDPATGSPTPAPFRPTPPGPVMPERFGRYRILRRLGRGGMGTVYLAHDTQLDREVALKVPRFSEDDGPDVVERFYREARAAAGLRHPNVCPVYDVGDVEGVPYLTMAYIDGRPLSDLIAEGPQPQDWAAELARRLAHALEFTHRQGVVHRDLKPANVLVGTDGEPAVTDFGLARRLNKADARLTRSGDLIGTPAYMAPEQASGGAETAGPAADVYALGVILYELLTGRLPFRGSLGSVLAQAVSAEPERPSSLRPDLDPHLEVIVMKAMAKRVENRYGSMAELATALDDYREAPRPVNRIAALRPQPTPAARPGRPGKPPRWRAAAVVTLAAAAAVVVLTGIVIVFRDKDGKETKVALPDGVLGSTFRIEDGTGRVLTNGKLPKPPGETGTPKETAGFELPKPRIIKGHTNQVNAVALSPDNKLLATGSDDRTIRLWDVASGERKERIPYSTAFKCLAFAPDGNTLAAGGDEGYVTIWDVSTGEKRSEFKADDRRDISLIGYSPDGKTLAVVPYDSYAVHLWDVQQKKVRTSLKGHGGWVSAVTFSPDGATVATSGSDATIRLWDVRDGKERDSLRAHDGRSDCLAFHGNDRLISGGNDGTVIVWDVAGARKGNLIKPVLEAPQTDPDYRRILNVFVTPRGQVVSVTARWDLDVWEPGQAKPLYHRKGAGGTGTTYYHTRTTLSSDGRTLVGAFGSNVELYDVSPYTDKGK